MTTEHSMATFQATAVELWKTHEGALSTIATQYIDLVMAKPKGAKVAELYSVLPKQWRDRVKEASFVAVFSKATGIVRLFDEAKADGRMVKYANAKALVEFHGSLEKAEKVLKPAKVDPKDETPKATKETKTETKTETKATAPVADKFAQVCELIDELNESDLKALQMLVADKIQKMQAKATVKV